MRVADVLFLRWEYTGPRPVMRGAAKQQLGTTNAVAAQNLQQAQALENQLVPLYTSQLNAGYSPTEEAAMTTAGMGAAAAPFDTASQEALNRAARTRNAAGVQAAQDRLALEKGEAMGNEAAGLQTQFANEELAQRAAAERGLQSLYGTNVNAMESMYGLGPATIAQENAPPWWLSPVMQGATGAGQALARVAAA